ncbi:hypothetical protein [Amycolatopsis sp. PS_44_ISF1]|uniref:hypothetical protein n=1 Tax=Amycolatopsis sp. PS_44_ISF1 TaxID=2974917 RepID=UPI0028DFF56B|nr:hypothetical protein [Amycolatopsis sp. PS_44_ISF1]MDT8916245.1 hypothetical protein [Amycolatopsis sp. PS_44_ISF1]
MSAPPFQLLYTPEATSILGDLRAKKQYAPKLKKVRKALAFLEQQGPSYIGLRTHPMQSIPGPGGATLYQSYVENNTPGAWRIWWIYGPADDAITIVSLGPHPD